ncbi:hypothetical protein AQUCO_05300118v1 [Aquilegia coerulea]|uniref:Uncharacterized protein n=1 Tax=Aquilegia coerulea TaxID=218851 RepID=A0A2G5CIE4_AQUCA|nr:hypothetical protein AQUCO_05300118v1 [Aquilegia coerulea]
MICRLIMEDGRDRNVKGGEKNIKKVSFTSYQKMTKLLTMQCNHKVTKTTMSESYYKIVLQSMYYKALRIYMCLHCIVNAVSTCAAPHFWQSHGQN